MKAKALVTFDNFDDLLALVKGDREARAAREQAWQTPVERLEEDLTWHASVLRGRRLLKGHIYRLTPDPEPIYRPYADEEWTQCVGDWFRLKETNHVYLAVGRSTDALFVCDRWYNAESAFRLLEHCDQVTGKTSPCGVLQSPYCCGVLQSPYWTSRE